MSEWQPIETAPKDGTPILLAIAGGRHYPRSGWWDADFGEWVVRSNGTDATYMEGLTHWMPLPEPPK